MWSRGIRKNEIQTKSEDLRDFERLIIQSLITTHPEHVRGALVMETRGWSTETFARGIRAAEKAMLEEVRNHEQLRVTF